MRIGALVFASLSSLLVGCSSDPPAPPADLTLVLAAYSAPREAFETDILPAFVRSELARSGKRVAVQTSYLASGAQARAILGGFAADVAVLAMAPDMDQLKDAGLVSADWQQGPECGVVTSSLVAFAVRPGNPKGIRKWQDLAAAHVEVLTPSPKTSGGAKWNLSALWGAAVRGDAGDPTMAADLFERVLRNVLVLDKGARESIVTFEKGVGDVAITYESEIVAGLRAGRRYDMVLPEATLLIEVPAAVVRKNADAHGVTEPAQALVAFLRSAEARALFAKHGFRPPDGSAVEGPESRVRAPPPPRLFRIDDLGGWAVIQPKLFGPSGLFAATWERISESE